MLHPALLVAIGSALGGVARWSLSTWIDTQHDHAFPWGTLAINVLGAALIGFLVVLVPREELRLLLITGLLGGFTTFSAFSQQTLSLLQEERYGLAALYAAGSVLLCLLACWLGWIAGRALSS
ncbi:MAG: fluoride efflux transporter CrcB [Planctomycetota bacterium]|nr:fluoride efflux transporter CrcB [Planctomycetota bacterium]MDW8372829.1 fluoride efflux transporter CrcB [Planctomycetota bacterium]